MRFIIWIIGVLTALEGILFLVKPQLYPKAASVFLKGKMVYLSAVVKLIFGVLFLIAARECRDFWIILTIGLVSAGSGLIMFSIDADKLKKIIRWVMNRPAWVIRLVAISALAFASLILYAAGIPQ